MSRESGAVPNSERDVVDPDTTGYPRKRAQTRRRLIEAGMVVLARSGPDGARVADVTGEAGVAVGTFYNHFPAMADLIDAVAGELSTGVEIGETTLLAIEHDPAVRVAIGTRQLLRLVDDDPRAAAAFVALLATVPDFRARVRGIVAGAIGDGVSSGRFPTANVDVVTDACLGSVVQWIRTIIAGETDRGSDRDRLEIMMTLVGLDARDRTAVIDRALAEPATSP